MDSCYKQLAWAHVENGMKNSKNDFHTVIFTKPGCIFANFSILITKKVKNALLAALALRK